MSKLNVYNKGCTGATFHGDVHITAHVTPTQECQVGNVVPKGKMRMLSHPNGMKYIDHLINGDQVNEL